MRWEWENKVSMQRLLQKLKDADSSGAVLTKAEAKFVYDLYEDKVKVLDKIRAEIMSKDGLEEALEIIDKYKAEGSDKE